MRSTLKKLSSQHWTAYSKQMRKQFHQFINYMTVQACACVRLHVRDTWCFSSLLTAAVSVSNHTRKKQRAATPRSRVARGYMTCVTDEVVWWRATLNKTVCVCACVWCRKFAHNTREHSGGVQGSAAITGGDWIQQLAARENNIKVSRNFRIFHTRVHKSALRATDLNTLGFGCESFHNLSLSYKRSFKSVCEGNFSEEIKHLVIIFTYTHRKVWKLELIFCFVSLQTLESENQFWVTFLKYITYQVQRTMKGVKKRLYCG